MKKVLMFIFIILLGFVRVKADPPFTVGIDTDYTTVYPGDKINVSIGLDYAWDEGLKVYEYDENTGEDHYLIGDNDYYWVRDIQLVFDKKVFSIDLSKVGIVDDNFVYSSASNYSIGNKSVYEFSLYMKDIREAEDNEDEYLDGVLDDVLLKNIILTVNKNANPGTYHLEVAFSDLSEYNRENKYVDYNTVISKYPITVISNSLKDKSVGRVYFTTGESQFLKSEKFEYIPKDDSNEYKDLFTEEIKYVNISCNTRCKVAKLGETEAIDRWKEENNFKVTFQDNTSLNYKIINEIFKSSIDYSWTDYDWPSIIVLADGNKDDYKQLLDDLTSEVKFKYARNDDTFTSLEYYKYSKLNDTDKKLLNKLFKNDSKSYIYVIAYGRIQNKSNDVSEESIKKLISEISGNPYKANNNDNSGNDISQNKTDNLLFDNIYYIILIGVGIICIIILVVVLLTSKKKIENQIVK